MLIYFLSQPNVSYFRNNSSINTHSQKQHIEAATGGVLYKKVFLEISQNSQENTCARVSFLIKLQASSLQFIKKETLAQVFSCEFCEISKNTFLHRTSLDDCF